MLILTRRVGEAIHIGTDITVVVLGVKGNQVRMGTEAPREVPVHREQIVDPIRRDTSAAPDERRAAGTAKRHRWQHAPRRRGSARG